MSDSNQVNPSNSSIGNIDFDPVRESDQLREQNGSLGSVAVRADDAAQQVFSLFSEGETKSYVLAEGRAQTTAGTKTLALKVRTVSRESIPSASGSVIEENNLSEALLQSAPKESKSALSALRSRVSRTFTHKKIYKEYVQEKSDQGKEVQITWQTATLGDLKDKEAVIAVPKSVKHSESIQRDYEITKGLLNVAKNMALESQQPSEEMTCLLALKGDIGETTIEGVKVPVVLREKAEYGDLEHVLKNGINNEPLTDEERLDIKIGMGAALQQLHDLGYSPGDMKLDNFLLFKGEDGKIIVKMTDFEKVLPLRGKGIQKKEYLIPRGRIGKLLHNIFPYRGNTRFVAPEKMGTVAADLYAMSLLCLTMDAEQYKEKIKKKIENIPKISREMVDPVDRGKRGERFFVDEFICRHKAFPTWENKGVGFKGLKSRLHNDFCRLKVGRLSQRRKKKQVETIQQFVKVFKNFLKEIKQSSNETEIERIEKQIEDLNFSERNLKLDQNKRDSTIADWQINLLLEKTKLETYVNDYSEASKDRKIARANKLLELCKNLSASQKEILKKSKKGKKLLQAVNHAKKFVVDYEKGLHQAHDEFSKEMDRRVSNDQDPLWGLSISPREDSTDLEES